jgi:hypothetical protein
MTTKWWKARLGMLAMVGALLICAIPAGGGEVAPCVLYSNSVGDPGGALSALDGNFLTLTGEAEEQQYVVVKFEAPLGPVGNVFTLRIHMDGTSAGVEDTAIWLSPTNSEGNPSGFVPFLGDYEIIGLYTSDGSPDDGLTGDWFQFSLYAGLFSFSEFQCVMIMAPVGASISIDAVEAYPFTTLPPLPPDPTTMIGGLITKVADFNLQQGIENGLDAKLDAALQALEDANANNDASAVNKLQAFINEVEAQRGTKLEPWQADQLHADAEAIIAALTAP